MKNPCVQGKESAALGGASVGGITIPGPCRTCGSAGHIWVGGEWVRGENTGTKARCPECAARTAIAFLLTRIGSWTNARWYQHVRFEYGDDVADVLIDKLREWNVPVEAYATGKTGSRHEVCGGFFSTSEVPEHVCRGGIYHPPVVEGATAKDSYAWRVGTKLGRTIYQGQNFEGLLESRHLATRIVGLLNAEEGKAPPIAGPRSAEWLDGHHAGWMQAITVYRPALGRLRAELDVMSTRAISAEGGMHLAAVVMGEMEQRTTPTPLKQETMDRAGDGAVSNIRASGEDPAVITAKASANIDSLLACKHQSFVVLVGGPHWCVTCGALHVEGFEWRLPADKEPST
jgi:hypothetical protein